MTYALSTALQEAVFTALTGDAALMALVGQDIYDAPPQLAPADVPELHVTLGEERVRDGSTKTSRGAVHDFSVTVHARTEGFSRPKAAAAAVCEALLDRDLPMARGHLVNLHMIEARAERGAANAPRRVRLRFRAVLQDSI
ncbi:DUF3168 domain-containing protein [Oceanibium sediminis]|uniref:DUF3168 domain-containing protein n=1 Tax=Oceanibium sediminis TaxID=2026339 RepID=UPI000DD33CA8|nr:DUF3168 domain-containing protein [Oceanibium sediminis]